MAASHFFIGLAAGLGILAVPVLVFTPGSSVPRHVIDWIEGPPAQTVQLGPDDNVAASRPVRGYQAGEPTPAAQAVPTLEGLPKPTAVPTRQPAAVAQAAQLAANTANLRWAGTAVIRSGGQPVIVRRVAGVDSSDDPQLADGSPVLISAGPPLQQGGQQWQAVRALNGIVGWVPSAQLAIDGQASATVPVQVAPATTPTSTVSRGTIANTGGSGVVLRNSPNDADRSRVGLREGTAVTLVEYAGADWVRVQAGGGQSGWVPARYVKPN
jgi:SH3-like domain-containing protein